ncbi:MAG: hypothetical protein Q4C61_17105 [Lachnospiraceae bacterium]|nr:hypothetical protein [Lachnospiraceae bacterium]
MSKEASKSQEKTMSRIYRGKEIFKPLNTGRIDERVSCVREFVANIFFYTKNGVTIMIDAGYNYDRLEEKLRWLWLKIITGHTGWTDDLDFAFAHRERVCNAWLRQKPHDPQAPYDAYDESDDTEERARSVYLKKQKGVKA